MKIIWILLAYIAFLPFVPTETQAETTYSADKVWTVTFTSELNPDTITNETVYIEDADGTKLEKIKFTFDDTKKRLYIDVLNDYKPGQYTLHITNKVTSKQGKQLKAATTKAFTIAENSPLAIVNQSQLSTQEQQLVENWAHYFSEVVAAETGVTGGIAVSKSTHKQEQLTAAAEQFASSSEEISASTEQLATAAHEYDEFMTRLSAAQHEMQMQVENTSKMLEMINAVAKSTRILGFNAGIEAARSGEFGRGFAVVAKEITKLADQSADSVNEIRQLVAQLNNKVDEVATVVQQSVKSSRNQALSIDEISQSVQHLTNVAETIEDMAKKI